MKKKALISFTVTGKLICVFVFAYAKSQFSHNEAHFFYTAQFLNFRTPSNCPVRTLIQIKRFYLGMIPPNGIANSEDPD